MENIAEIEEPPADSNVIPFESARRAPRLQSLSDEQMDALVQLVSVAPSLLRLAAKADDLERLLLTAEKIIARCPVAAHIVSDD